VTTIISVWCRSNGSITRQDIAQRIEDGVYLDDPKFEPPLDSEAALARDWQWMEIGFDPRRRPIQISREAVTNGLVEETLDELAEQFGNTALNSTAVRDHIISSRCIIDLEHAGDIPDDAWDACDAIEHFIASHLDGIIYVPGEGIYDADLQPILKRS
jgi:hypothetical protein